MKVSKAFVVSLVLIAVALGLFVYSDSRCAIRHAQKVQASQNAGSLRHALLSFHGVYSGFPTGTAAEIVSQLMSNNVRRIAFLELSSSSLNSSGEFMDPWDTPYRISINGTNVETRSAGPDMKFGTKDDIAAP